MNILEKAAVRRAAQPDQSMFGVQLPLTGSQLADALVVLRNMGRANVLSKALVAYEIDQMIAAWERQ